MRYPVYTPEMKNLTIRPDGSPELDLDYEVIIPGPLKLRLTAHNEREARTLGIYIARHLENLLRASVNGRHGAAKKLTFDPSHIVSAQINYQGATLERILKTNRPFRLLGLKWLFEEGK